MTNKPKVEVVDWAQRYIRTNPRRFAGISGDVDITIDGTERKVFAWCTKDDIKLEYDDRLLTDEQWDAVSDALEAEHRRLWDTRH
jgi:hypothetical protein